MAQRPCASAESTKWFPATHNSFAHTLCELGAEPLNQELKVIRRFLDRHPNQVLIVIVEDYVPPATIARAFEQTELAR